MPLTTTKGLGKHGIDIDSKVKASVIATIHIWLSLDRNGI